MVLISIHPFALRRVLLIVLALVGFSALCFADPVLMVRHYAPATERPQTRKPITDQNGAAAPRTEVFDLAAIENGDADSLAFESAVFGGRKCERRSRQSPMSGTSVLRSTFLITI